LNRRAHIFGYPIAHSISPQIHNAAFAAAGLAVHYSAREVAPADLPAAILDLRSAEVVGANLTVPHKVAVLALVDQVDEAVHLIGAANTVHQIGGQLRASNTDAPGFARSLVEAGITVGGRSAVLLGAGGSARAVAQALLGAGLQRLVIANRHLERAVRLAADCAERFPAARLEPRPLGELTAAELARLHLVVNTTTVGLHGNATPLTAQLLPAKAVVVDIIYNPPRTRLLREAEAAGLRTLNGLPMLVHQAAIAWETWMGQDAPLAAMWSAARAALGDSR
jgi:shikimate dehydrogenase